MLNVVNLKSEVKLENLTTDQHSFNASCYIATKLAEPDGGFAYAAPSMDTSNAFGIKLDSPALSTYTPWIPQPQLQNIVSTVNLGIPLKLHEIAQQARNIEYNPKRFGAAVLRIRSPRTTALLFASGKMVITGAKSEEQSREAGRKFARIVQKLGFKAEFFNFKIQNMVACANVNFAIRLEGVSVMHHQFCTYEPELFPGVVYRMVKPRAVLLIFSTGKVVITGARTQEDITEAFEKIYPLLKMFDKRE